MQMVRAQVAEREEMEPWRPQVDDVRQPIREKWQ